MLSAKSKVIQAALPEMTPIHDQASPGFQIKFCTVSLGAEFCTPIDCGARCSASIGVPSLAFLPPVIRPSAASIKRSSCQQSVQDVISALPWRLRAS